MNKFLFIALVLVSSSLFADVSEVSTPALVTEVQKEEKKFNPRASHWITTFGFEGLKYELPFEFDGEQNSFSPGKKELWGGRLGFGGEIYLGSGIITTSKIEGFYVGTLFSQVTTAGPEDDDVEFANRKQTGQVYGIDISQSLGFLFDMKTKNPFMDEWSYLTVEPFIEAGLGRARAYNRVDYMFDADIYEKYNHAIEDDLVNARIGAGINFTSQNGYMLYIRVTQNRYDISERKHKVVEWNNGDAARTANKFTEKDVDIDPVTIYAIGGGYKF